jgi:hypothetical protein
VGGTNDMLLMKNRVELKVILKWKFMSAPPEKGLPGAPGSWSGERLASFNELMIVVLFVVGSATGAPAYRRIAELIPFANPVMPTLGSALIQ